MFMVELLFRFNDHNRMKIDNIYLVILKRSCSMYIYNVNLWWKADLLIIVAKVQRLGVISVILIAIICNKRVRFFMDEEILLVK